MIGELLILAVVLGALGLGAWVVEGPIGQAWARHRSALRPDDWIGEGNSR